MKLTNNFWLKEFIDPITYKQYGNNSIWFLDKRIVLITQKLRTRLGISLFVNTWHMGGDKIYSGFRPPACTIGASKSQHRFGRAPDVKTDPDGDAEGAEMIRDEIKSNFKTYKDLGLTTIESAEYASTWCHLDTRWVDQDHLLIVKP